MKAQATDQEACPYCQQRLNNGACEHWVASLNDDSDGYDTATPLYFGWTNYCGEIHDKMIASMDSYFKGLCGVCEEVAQKGAGAAERVAVAARQFPSAEKATLQGGITLLKQPNALEDYETVGNLLMELNQQMKDLFDEFVRHCGGKVTNWEISEPPPYPYWSGTHYWAKDAKKCIGCIIQQSRDATDRLRKLNLKVLNS